MDRRRRGRGVPHSGPRPRQLTRALLQSGVEILAQQDPDLASIVVRYGPPPLWARRPGFTALARIILEQQVSLAAARTMFERVRLAAEGVTPSGIARLGVGGLRGLGITGPKASYLHDLARSIHTGALDLGAVARAPDPIGRERLLAIRGLGPWSVDCYYLVALRRPDVWPHGDLALADAVREVKRLRARPDYDRLTRMAQRWAPWRSVAARLLWHHYLASRGRSA